jgi:hypothetical protein
MKGIRGVRFNDRELAGRVREMGLNHLKRILADDYEDKQFQREILLRLSSNLLPRLNEVTGEDGGAIEIKGVEIKVRK